MYPISGPLGQDTHARATDAEAAVGQPTWQQPENRPRFTYAPSALTRRRTELTAVLPRENGVLCGRPAGQGDGYRLLLAGGGGGV